MRLSSYGKMLFLFGFDRGRNRKNARADHGQDKLVLLAQVREKLGEAAKGPEKVQVGIGKVNQTGIVAVPSLILSISSLTPSAVTPSLREDSAHPHALRHWNGVALP